MMANTITGENPFQVLQRVCEWQIEGRVCALVIITSTEGGAVRAPGALLAVCEESSLGYISGGCIDADVVLQARQAMNEGTSRALRYGAGSPFVDLPLPCGGAIEVTICPAPNPALIAQVTKTLSERRRISIYLSSNGQLALRTSELDEPMSAMRFDYDPPLRLRIAGRGADALALAKISEAAGYDTRLQLVDENDIRDAHNLGLMRIEQLQAASDLPVAGDDPWTAFVLLFHDRDFEIPLLMQALNGSAQYIGAVGSRRTHAIRCDALREAGFAESQIARVHGPIGIVPSLRDASAIAISTLAEIIETAKRCSARHEARTGFVLLAAGASQRFETGDKLLARLNGKPVLEHAASILERFSPSASIAVVSNVDRQRADILAAAGWSIITNKDAAQGQASSIACAIQTLQTRGDVDQVVLLLGDMPYVPHDHIDALLHRAEHPSIDAIMSTCDDVLLPPALFKRKLFPALSARSGDEGAKSIFLGLETGASTISLPKNAALDIDCVADLERAKEADHA